MSVALLASGAGAFHCTLNCQVSPKKIVAPASALTVGKFNCGSPQFRNGRCNQKFNFQLHPQEGPKGDSHPVYGAVTNGRWVSFVESPFDSISVLSIAQCSLSHGHRSLDSGCDDHSKFRCFWLFSGGVSGPISLQLDYRFA